tara:strand:- start:1067 stop:1765 length:699 start_codon:yes stop_codon:yes gene_type:complete
LSQAGADVQPEDSMNQLRVTGPETTAATILMAHGAGAGMDTPFMERVAQGLAEREWQVIRFEFPYMTHQRISGRRTPPNKLDILLRSFLDQVMALDANRSLVIGGKSMGGRVASLIADELYSDSRILGCVCLGYPFHPLGKPQTLRVNHLIKLRTPTLIVQGERDAMGSREEVEQFSLSRQLQFNWMPDGDHSFKPRRRSGRSEEQNLNLAVQKVHHFLVSLTTAVTETAAD